MRAVLGRFFLALSVLAASLVFSTASPATATTPSLCPPGTYVSSYDASICNSTPPGTYTDTAGATEPIPCDPGTYQPYYGRTSCLETPRGAANVSAGSEVPNNCSPGTFTDFEGANACVPAPPGYYIQDAGATDIIPCPAAPPAIGVSVNDTRVGNIQVIDCFDFGVNTIVLPTASSTVNNEIQFEFFLSTEIASGNNVQLTFTDTLGTDPKPVYQFVAQANSVDADLKRGTITVPLTWQNANFFRGCTTSCPSGTPITTLPLSTYDIKVEAKDNSTPSAWVDLGTVGAVQVTDTVTTKPQIYSQGWSYFEVTASANVGVNLPEARMTGSTKVVFADAPSYLNPTTFRTFTLIDGTLSEYTELSFNGTSTSPDVASVTGSITPGQWWVSVTYRDSRGSTAASNEWPYPLLITRSCEPGNFSVDGIEACVPAPAGRWIAYPSPEAFNLITRLFEPSQCARGSYQPSPGGVACLAAAPGYFVSQTGSLEQTVCPLGKYQPSAGAEECLPASANYYVDKIKSKAQKACPALTYSPVRATSRADCKPKPCVVKKSKSATSTCMLASIAKTLPAKAKVTIKMKSSFKRTCKVEGSKVKALKRGTCTVTLTVKPKKGKSIRYVVKVTGV